MNIYMYLYIYIWLVWISRQSAAVFFELFLNEYLISIKTNTKTEGLSNAHERYVWIWIAGRAWNVSGTLRYFQGNDWLWYVVAKEKLRLLYVTLPVLIPGFPLLIFQLRGLYTVSSHICFGKWSECHEVLNRMTTVTMYGIIEIKMIRPIYSSNEHRGYYSNSRNLSNFDCYLAYLKCVPLFS